MGTNSSSAVLVSPDDFLKQSESPTVSPEDFLKAPAPASATPVKLPGTPSPYQIQTEEIKPKTSPYWVTPVIGSQQSAAVEKNVQTQPSDELGKFARDMGQLKDLILGPEDWTVGMKDLIPPDSKNPAARAMRGVLGAADTLLTPRNIELGALVGGVGGAAAAATSTNTGALIKAGVTGYFGAKALQSVLDRYPQAKEHYQNGDWDAFAEDLGYGGASALLAGILGREAYKGATSGVEGGIARHNVVAEQALKQEANQPSYNPASSEFVLGGTAIPFKIGDQNVEIRPSGMSQEGRPGYDVVNVDTGKTMFGGYGPAVNEWIGQQQRLNPSVESFASAPTPVPIVEPAGRTAAPIVSPEDFLKSNDLVAGKQFQKGNTTYSVTSVEDGKIRFDAKDAAGNMKSDSLPESVFRKMVASATPLPQVSVPPSQKEVVQPNPEVAAVPGTAGAAEEVPNVNGVDQGVQQPGEVRPSEGVPAGAPAFAPQLPLSVRGLPQQGASAPSSGEPQPVVGNPGGNSGGQVQLSGAVEKGPEVEDVVTGTEDPKLTTEGAIQAGNEAPKVANIKQVYTTPMDRGEQTARIVATKGASIIPDEAFGPWNLGQFQGQRQSDVEPQILDAMLKTPDKAVPGGESFNSFKDPLIGAVQKQIADWKPGERVLNVTHSIDIHTVNAWADNGAPEDKSISAEFMNNRPKMDAAALWRLDPKTLAMTPAENSEQPGIYFLRHGATSWDNVPKAGAPANPANPASSTPANTAPLQSGAPSKITTPKEAFRMKAPELTELAKKGDAGAATELKRRGKSVPKVEVTPTGVQPEKAVTLEPSAKYPNLDRFMEAYERNLRTMLETPQFRAQYAYGPEKAGEVAQRMKAAIENGTASLQGPAFIRTAKEFGIKPTEREIKQFLAQQPPVAEKKPVTPQVPNEPGTKYVLPAFATKGAAKGEALQTGAEATPLETSVEKPTINAGNEPTAQQPAGEQNPKPLAEELPQGNGSAGAVEPVAASSPTSSRKRSTRKRASAGEGPELEPSGGTISGAVGDPAKPEQTFPPRAQDVVSTHHDRDYRIPDGRVISGSPETRAKGNIEAIRTLREIQQQNRNATVEEQKILAQYVGWGAVPQLFAQRQGFEGFHKELKDLLSEEEFEEAQRSTTNAHYTSDEIVDAMWKAVQSFGAKPGMSWLEPAVGVGNFFGRQPQELLEGARRVGLDKDSLSAQIAKLLYPDSGIDHVAFEDAELPNNYFDGSVSNIPFGNFGVHDATFKSKPYLTNPIHNYFFARTMQSVRPGGVVAFVTSRYTMDAMGPAAVNFRKYIAEQAHLIGAIRLPTGAFRHSSGTDVITDLIFLRKKLPDEGKNLGDAFERSVRKQIPSQYGYGVPIETNEYFQQHPENVLGTEQTGRGQFSANDYDVKGTVTPQQIADAVSKFSDIGFEDWQRGQKKRTVALREINAPTEQSKLGGLFFDDKGNLFRKTSKGSAEPVDVADSAKARIKQQLGIRNALVSLTSAELSDAPDAKLKTLRSNLNQAYDAFVKKYGPLSSQANTAAMSGDPDAPLLVSLERNFQKGNKAKGITPSAEKAPILSRRMLKPAAPPTSVSDPKEALYIALNETGRVDFARMSDLTGKTSEQLQQDLGGLVYQDPHTKIWQTADEYLSGSVRKKLKEARAIAKIEPQYAPNVKALEEIQPEDIPPGEIRALLGVSWVPLQTYGDFATDILGASKPVSVKYVAGNWMVDTGWGNQLSNKDKWGTARVPADDLLNDSLNMVRTKVIDRFSDGSTAVNADETQTARAKQMEMQEHFEKWLFEDPKRGDELTRLYNDTHNDLRLRHFDGSHLTLPGMSTSILRSGDLDVHQKSAVWRVISQPNVLLAHSVGSGKTFEMIASGMELKRLGLIRRPMYVVPNATLTSWQDQFSALYPQARTLVFSEKDLEKENRKRVMAQIATGDWDAVVVPHSSFQFLPTGDEIFNEHYKKLEDELEEQVKEAQAEGMDTRMIKRMEKSKERLLTSLKDRRANEKKDQTVTWEQMGIDHLFVDECFPSGTMVQTDRGALPIEEIVLGKLVVNVLSFNHACGIMEWKAVTGWFKNPDRRPLVVIHHEQGRFICTADHEVWTEEDGYVPACLLSKNHNLQALPNGEESQESWQENGVVLFSQLSNPIPCGFAQGDEILRMVREAILLQKQGSKGRQASEILQPDMFSALENGSTGSNRFSSREEAMAVASCGPKGSSAIPANERKKSDGDSWNKRKGERQTQGSYIPFSRRERDSYSSAVEVGRNAVFPDGVSGADGSGQGEIPQSAKLLQSGLGSRGYTNSNRGGRLLSQGAALEVSGQAENGNTFRSRVERVEIFKLPSNAGNGDGKGRDTSVYCLKVQDNHNFYAEGILVSNCHEFKKLGFATKQGNIAGIDNEGNQKTFDLLMKMRYTQSHGRGVVFASGTPITNTMGEMFSIMKYLIEPELEARGLGKFDEWAANFGRTVDVFEPKVQGGGYQMKARFAKFVNLPELIQLFRSFADVVTSDMIKLPIPNLVGGERMGATSDLTEYQEEILKDLQRRAENIKSDPRNALPDNMLAVYSDAAKMAMDARMINPAIPDNPDGRLTQAADKIYGHWKDSAKVKGTQLVISDMGKPASEGGSSEFSAYDDLIKKLEDRGIPRNEIATIYQAKNKAQRAQLFRDINDGKIRVVLGSTQKMGVGVNIQKRLYALHHLDIPHRPSDLEQREGRILRQGNENPEVYVHYYMTRGSLDEAKFANVIRKAKFINSAMQGKTTVRETEDVGGMIASLQMFQAATSGDPRVMKKMEVDAEVDRLSGVYSGWKNQQYKIRNELQTVPGRIQGAQKSIEITKADMAVRDKTGEKWTVGKQKFEGDKISKDVNDALTKQVHKVANDKGEDVPIGTAFGLPLEANYSTFAKTVTVNIGNVTNVTLTSGDMEGAMDLYRRIKNQVEGLDSRVSDKEQLIERAEREQINLQKSIEDKWPYADKFHKLQEEQQQLVKDLGGDKGDEAAIAAQQGQEIADKSVEAEEAPDTEEEEGEEKPIGLTAQKKAERGSVPGDFLGIEKFVKKEVVPSAINVARLIHETRSDILKVIAPAAREGAASTALTIRERAADLARSTDRAVAAMDTAKAYFDSQDVNSNLDFIDRIENGLKQPDAKLQGIADTVRQILDDRRQKVQDLGNGKLENFYEDYFPHIWKKSDDAERAFKSWFAKRPMEGSKSFLKQRKIPTIKDGIDMGLEPESTNPVDLLLAKVREMDKYIFAHRALNDLKEMGVIKFKRATERMPEGFAKINDKIATVYEGKTEQGSLAIRGEYVAPEPAATLINNYLSPGLRKYASFRAYMGLGNMLNQFQLGWSAYHAGFTTFEAAVSRMALGIGQIAHGASVGSPQQILKGLGSIASAPTAPFTGVVLGDKMLKEWYKPGTQGQQIGELVDAMMMAGGRARMDKFYQTQVTKKMMEALRQGNLLGAAMRAPFALTEQAARPIMEWLVPRQKMAAFADFAKDEFGRFEEHGDPAQLRAALAKAWDSIDNRMGQLVYDNLFWNKAAKDLAMASVRSVGWNVGTIREIVGGGADTLRAAAKIAGGKGKEAEFTRRMQYIIALPLLAGIIGGLIHYLRTGEHPSELKDWFFPRRGPKGTPGWSKRMALPNYVKDVAHWVHDPTGTVKGKIHPLAELIWEMLSNEDYFGKHIRNSNDPIVKQMEDELKHVGEAVEPIAARPLTAPDKKGQETTAEKVLPFVGITEAPKYIKESEPEKPRHYRHQ